MRAHRRWGVGGGFAKLGEQPINHTAQDTLKWRQAPPEGPSASTSPWVWVHTGMGCQGGKKAMEKEELPLSGMRTSTNFTDAQLCCYGRNSWRSFSFETLFARARQNHQHGAGRRTHEDAWRPCPPRAKLSHPRPTRAPSSRPPRCWPPVGVRGQP